VECTRSIVWAASRSAAWRVPALPRTNRAPILTSAADTTSQLGVP